MEPWSRAELLAAILAWEAELLGAGKTPLTVNTYVRDARRFVEWLPANEDDDRSTAPVSVRPPPKDPTAPLARREYAAIESLAELASRWSDAGRPNQPGIRWPKARWLAAFPQRAALFESLPRLLDRGAVQAVATRAHVGPDSSVNAFLATLAWGYGQVGYGQHRAVRALSTYGAPARLQRVAETLRTDGPVAAYRRLGSDLRLEGLGPAFGTKYLAFAQHPADRPRALIHDSLVCTWLREQGRPDLTTTGWAPATYGAYLSQMDAWAIALALPPEDVEYLIFQEMADRRGGQWSAGR